ncbi:hypothetical protein PBF_06416 [Cytobacillus firmus DS1]|uniref:Uncharacterized protein n=1 Tax=Cytobacillus firmus DS1 TaxID=1307436 RepID=W7LI47_CYTFI|nr:hypothetical protein PBF_06416 [Cytobacillus firmus DS1]
MYSNQKQAAIGLLFIVLALIAAVAEVGAFYIKYSFFIRNFTHSWYINREKESDDMYSSGRVII